MFLEAFSLDFEWIVAFIFHTCDRDDNARLDTNASSFRGGWFQSSFFDVRIFNSYAPLN